MSTATKTPTSAANLARISVAFNTLEPLMVNLAGRWMDEKAFENIDDYAAAVRPHLPEGFTLIRMTKRPFGFVFSVGTDARYHMCIKGNSFSWTRIADAPEAK